MGGYRERAELAEAAAVALSKARTQGSDDHSFGFLQPGHCPASKQMQQGAFLSGNLLSHEGGQSRWVVILLFP